MKKSFYSTALVIIFILMAGIFQPGFAKPESRDVIDLSSKPLIEITPDIFHNDPDYDCGWITISQGEVKTLNHALGGDPDKYVVDLQFKDSAKPGFGVHQEDYGGVEFHDYLPPNNGALLQRGAYWFGLTGNSITVKRQVDDTKADQVRVRIWVAPAPNYDSDWKLFQSGSNLLELDHNFGGDTNDYIVDLQFKDKDLSGFGVNQYAYGLIISYFDNTNLESIGANWWNLSAKSINISRGSIDTTADEARLRIWKNDDPDYDSGWIELSTSTTKTLKHDLGGNSDDYVVDLQFNDETYWKINQILYGSNHYNTPPDGSTDDRKGALWTGLTKTHISIWRERDDTSAPKARLRIWTTKQYDNHIYLPIQIR